MSGTPLTLGTAGHVDHGKTTLVGRLTGTDTDRLVEEKRRGLSIELGYARLELPGGRAMSVVDVPGHERFVRTMVAGATGIDCFLMTVAADDGVMPQTREHARVLAGLGVNRGVVAVTKSDLADPGRASGQARALIPGATVVSVCARTGDGLRGLVSALTRLAAEIPVRDETGGEPRLHVDRVFTIKGAGTVVTGTLWSGRVSRGDHVWLVASGRRCRVRAVHVHDEGQESASAGQRVALNLVGVSRHQVSRGEVVAGVGTQLRATRAIDVELDIAEPVADGERVQVHHGTAESPGRLRGPTGRRWRLRLERPLLAAQGDRLVVRRISPPGTLGGGVVIDPRPGAKPPVTGPPAVRAPTSDSMPEPLSERALELEQRLLAAGHQPPLASELTGMEDALTALQRAGRAVRVGPRLYFHPAALEDVARLISDHLAHNDAITVAALRDRLQTSRKYAQALLEHFDGEGLTLRRGDVHVLRRHGRRRALERS